MRTLLISMAVALISGPVLADATARQNMGDMVGQDRHNPHIQMSPPHGTAPGDQARALEIAHELRAAIEKYKDVEVARADGYRQFGSKNVREIHFYHPRRSMAERRRLDPSAPSNLLYTYSRSEGYKLIGAMFTAPAGATPAQLNARVPLSQARWHLHVNVCLPKKRRDWRRRDGNGQILFGPTGAIAKRQHCREEGGRFHPRLFGWMVHVYPFRADPNAWWKQHHG